VRSVLSWLAACLLLALVAPRGEAAALPRSEGSFRFAVLGGSGNGSPDEYELGEQLAKKQELLRFGLVLMTGDNIQGVANPAAYREKFEDPFEDLLDAGVKFYAVLGNKDDAGQRNYEAFHMSGHRYYSFAPEGAHVRFFALDSGYMDQTQLGWLEHELAASHEDWKIAFMNHSLYSAEPGDAGRALREALQPMFERYGVSAVFSGREQAYERLAPQHGVAYFVSGAAGAHKARRGRAAAVAARFDAGCHFLALEIAGDTLYFEAIDVNGKSVDSGSLPRAAATPAAKRP
jgi:hypothetical protein